jgi:thioesterase domain-containing protein
MSYAFRLKGKLDIGALKQALQEIVNRHEALRTTFEWRDNKPVPVIAPALVLDVPLIDLQSQAGEEREAELERIIRDITGRPFDLATGPLVQAWLIRCGHDGRADAEYAFVAMFDHIVFDGWSYAVFVRELSTLYSAFHTQRSSPLPPLPIQHADYAIWQRNWIESEEGGRQMAYWQSRLGGDVPMLQLPADRLSLPVQTYQGAYQSRPLDRQLAEALRVFCRQHHVTLFVGMLAVFQVLLHRYTDQNDLVVCTPIAGRQQSETEDLIGYLNNVVPLRTDLSGDPTFAELVPCVREVVLEAYDHQDVPFQVVADLPNLVRTSLSRALFLMPESLGATLTLTGIRVEQTSVENRSAYFDLSLVVREREGSLVCTLWYKSDLFSQATIADMLENLQVLLQEIVADPNQPLSSLPTFVVSKAESVAGTVSSGFDGARSNERYIAPQDVLEVQLARIWENVLDCRPIGIRDNFFDLGGHSLLAVRLFAQIEEQLTGQKLPLAILLRSPTVERLAEVLRNEGWASCWSSLVPIQPNGSNPPLFFVHAHGGNVVGYYDLARLLGPDQPFFGLQAQGLDGQSPGFQRLEDMAAHYVREIRTVQPQGPYYLGGWCFGGTLAKEMAHQLLKQGQEVAFLALVESSHRDYPQYLPGVTGFRRLRYHVADVVCREVSNLIEVDTRKKWAYIMQRIDRIKTIIQVKAEKALDASLARFKVKINHSHAYKLAMLGEIHTRLIGDYRGTPYPGSMTLFRAEKQPSGIHVDPTLGWGPLVEGELEILELPGHPIGLLQEPRVHVSARRIKAALEKAQQRYVQRDQSVGSGVSCK